MQGIYYENSKGIKLNLLKPPYRLQTADFFDYEWEYVTASSGRKSGKITKFKKSVSERQAVLGISGKTKDEYYAAIDHFYDVTEYDTINLVHGKLWIGKYYLPCYIFAAKKEAWEYGIEVLDNTISIVTDAPMWCKEKSYSFKASDKQIINTEEKEEISDILDSASQNPDYPWDYKKDFKSRYKPAQKRYLRDYKYDFYSNHTVRKIDNDHFAGSAFKMIIYGPCTHPFIQIGEHIYEVNTTLYDSEYLVIDSRERTVIKYTRYGATENLFNARSREHYLFQQIPAGKSLVKWNATYPFDLVLYQERSEPPWSM